ncbi:unnamed protein product [Eruca vesicaria subsp. sativa]|uniref:Wax synthase domain-containing protein n=1 Tax=Eruca vesicaria subsp. sativa TaxID=29727 RepID=A0ABC8LMZ9_ERUVS|nr:unnamed protein product [Eruca vesicaria subsp. sativa]
MYTVSFIYVWGLVMVSLCYTFYVAKLVGRGTMRQILIFPVFLIFFIVPLLVSSIHLVCITAFFIAWLANFKIILFAFGRGPLYSNLSLPVFVAVSSLPIKIQLSPKPSTLQGSREGLLNYAKKFALLVIVTKIIEYSSKLPDKAVLTLYVMLHSYFTLEVILSTVSVVVRATTNLELEPQFNKPHMATSLQNFWGRRWNLMVTGILRPTVYEPMIQLLSSGGLSRNPSQYLAVFITFAVSGLMHVLIFFYIGRLRPDWKVMWFFLINGFCTSVEIAIKKNVKGRFPTAISRVLTIGFVMVTSWWLFFPEFKRCNLFERVFQEYVSIGAFAAGIKNIITTSLFSAYRS